MQVCVLRFLADYSTHGVCVPTQAMRYLPNDHTYPAHYLSCEPLYGVNLLHPQRQGVYAARDRAAHLIARRMSPVHTHTIKSDAKRPTLFRLRRAPLHGCDLWTRAYRVCLRAGKRATHRIVPGTSDGSSQADDSPLRNPYENSSHPRVHDPDWKHNARVNLRGSPRSQSYSLYWMDNNSLT